MLKFCANLTMLFNEVEFPARFEAARRAGFKGVEYLFPYAFRKDDLATRLNDNGLTQALFNLPPGDWDKGERGIAALPGREAEFRASIGRAGEYAEALGCRTVNCLAGIPDAEARQEHIRATFVQNVRFAADALKRQGVRLVIEPINNFDIPGFWLNRVALAAEIIAESGSDNAYIQYDLYHQQRTGGELVATYRLHQKRIAHIQLADNPGRNEPGSGEINYPFVLGEIDRSGYEGWIGCEYRPRGETTAGLGWLETYRERKEHP
jgi:hydroxypyruvate isomerase